LGPSLLVLCGDFLKGALPVLVAARLCPHVTLQVVAALGAVVGHDWPLYAGFKGGRGVATSFGATVAMVPPVGLALLLVGVAVVYMYRYVSLMSILGAPTGALLVWILVGLGREPLAYGIWSLLAAALILILHRDNIARLRNGTEPKIGEGGRRRPFPGNTRA
jgi:acyl phosphate:glycerol-3-phosphate acyltransferase